ncbi:MAG: serine hydrolase domain-containing protein [Ilumatobacteraceae bacterium]
MTTTLPDLPAQIDGIVADTGFVGVVRVDTPAGTHAAAYGLANRAYGIPNTPDTHFGLASGAKGFTALTVLSLVEDGVLSLATTARSLLGGDLPLIDDAVTVEHLLTHRSGIGDYLDEEVETDFNEYLMPLPVQQMVTTEDYVAALGDLPQKFAPGARFSYCNGGFVVLALLAERAAGVPFHDLVDQRVCVPAGLTDTAFLRGDELPGTAAIGYLEDDGLRTNVLHLPVRGNGDGGIYSTAADIHRLWGALFAGRIVSPAMVAEMTRIHVAEADDDRAYGLGFWLSADGGIVGLIGGDAGVGFRSNHALDGSFTYSLLSNKGRGTWPTSQRLEQLLLA